MDEEKIRFKIKLPPYAIYGLISLVILSAAIIFSLFAVPKGGIIVIKGVIGDKLSLLKLSLAATAVCGINLLASWGVFKKDRVISHILGALAIFISIIILLKITAIILVY
ncbi:MAG: hypothetical protein WC519_02355 [Parcubacteria group bacterium]